MARWPEYLESYHRQRAGITERAFEHSRDVVLGTPYDWLVDALPSRLGDVLDVACGNAPVQPRLPHASSYLGVDLSDSELAAARALGRGPVTRGDARSLPVPALSADTVVSTMGLMLVTPLVAAVREVSRVLRGAGTAAFLLPTVWPLRPSDVRPLAALTWHLRGPGAMPHRVTRRRLGRLLRRSGLTVADASTHRFVFPLETAEHAHLAVQSLYTPGRSPVQLAAAEAALAGLAAPGRHLPLPLLRLVARKDG